VKTKKQTSNQLRIIGGTWRGRKLSFADGKSLRPTLDRVRETLFNWLQFDLAGARCLDLFSGSGALGFEALSRGAEFVTMLDTNPTAIKQIKHNLQLLDCNRAEVLSLDALEFLKCQGNRKTYNVVFLDPPFQQNLLSNCCQALEQYHFLSAGAFIYIEAEKQLQLSELPQSWQLLKEKKAGQLKYYLFQNEA